MSRGGQSGASLGDSRGDEPAGSNPLTNFYYKIEDKYYDLCDWLTEKGAPVYDWFVKPIESHGIPSFPIAILLLLLIAGGAVFIATSGSALPNLFAGGAQTASLQVAVANSGTPIAGAQVQVTVDGQSYGVQQTGADGTATFTGLPSGKLAQVSVSKDGFQAYSSQVVVGQSATFSASLSSSQPAPTATPPVSATQLTVTDSSTQEPISNAKVIYRDSQLGVQQVYTAADGTVQLQMTDNTVTAYVTADGYTGTQQVITNGIPAQVALTPDSSQTANFSNPSCSGSNCPQPQSTVTVTALDASGNPVDGTVQLFDSAQQGPIQTAQTSGGVASFPDAVSQGEVIYALIYPTNSQYVSPSQSSAVTAQGTQTNLQINVKAGSSLGPGLPDELQARVLDDAGNPVPGATVYLYAGGSSNALATNQTDDTGVTSFQVVSEQAFSLTAYAPGYVPSIPVNIGAGDLLANLVVPRMLIGSYTNVTVNVLDIDGQTPVPGATVSLFYTGSNIPTGLPLQYTDASGNAYLGPVPLNQNLQAIATNGPYQGSTEAFYPSVSSPNNYSITLQRPNATVYFQINNPLNGAGVANANITANDSNGNTVGGCMTNSTGGCVTPLEAGAPLTFYIDAPGFLQTEVDGINLVAGSVNYYPISNDLIPLSLESSNEMIVNLLQSDCMTPVTTPVLERGQSYCLAVDYNVPSNQTNPDGFLVRLGSDGNAESDPAAFTYLPSFSDLNLNPNQLSVTRSDNYQSESGFNCSYSAQQTTSTMSKWVNYEFTNLQGDKVVMLRFVVSPNATDTQSVAINYMSYAANNGNYYRVPNDPNLGTSYSNGDEDWCQALTNTTTYGIADGNFTYNAQAGAQVTFTNPGNSYSSPSELSPVGSNFLVNVNFRYYNQPTSPYVRIYTTTPTGAAEPYVKIINFTSPALQGSSAPLGGTSDETANLDASQIPDNGGVWESNVSFFVQSELVVPSALVNVEVGDAGNPLVTLSGVMRIDGTGQLVLTLSNTQFPVNSPQSVTVTAQTPDGTPVTDTNIEVYSINGNVFGPNYNNGQIEVVGDDTTGQGLNGQYTFSNINPLQPGMFAFQAGGTIDNRFASTQAIANATNNNFISVFPSSLALTCAATQLTVTNSLSYTSALVTLNFTDNACAQLAGNGVTCIDESGSSCLSYEVNIPESSSVNVFVNPIRSTSCTLVASSTLGPTATSVDVIPTQVSCSAQTPTCDLGVNPLSVTGGSGSASQTTLTAALHDIPVEPGLVAAYSCGQPGTQVTYSPVEDTGNGIDFVSTGTCSYLSVGSPTQYTPSVQILTPYNQPVASCSANNSVTVFQSGVTGSTCLLSYQPQPQSSTAALTADFFNIPSSITSAFFQCTPNSQPQQVPLTQFGSDQATATYDCDYTGQDGVTFNATAEAGTAFCYNSTVTITPSGGECTHGSETIPYGQCSQSAPWLRCEGANPSSPSLSADSTCCPQELGSGYSYGSNPPGCYSTNTNTGVTCSDGQTTPGTCQVQNTPGGSVPGPWYCPLGATTGASMALNTTCCSQLPGFTFDSATNTCEPVSASESQNCTITSGSGSIVSTITYGTCATQYPGLECEGDPTSPALSGQTSCCPSGTSWCSNLNECSSTCTPTSNMCDGTTSVGQCELPPAGSAQAAPSPYRCESGNLGSPASYVQDATCCIPENGNTYQVSDNGDYCVQVPPSQVQPQCTITANSLGPSSDNTSVNGVFNISGTSLDAFEDGGTITYKYSCDSGNQALQTQTVTLSSGTDTASLPFACNYARSYFDYAIQPAAQLVLVSRSQQQTIACANNGTIMDNSPINITGTNGQGISFTALEFAGNEGTPWPQVGAPNYPLGPLQGVLLEVNATNLPQGLTSSNFQLSVACDPLSNQDTLTPMTLSPIEDDVWMAYCSYSSNQQGTSWPVGHTPRAFYRVNVNNQYYPANSQAGVPAAFATIYEYAQPIASSITATTLSLPSVQNESLVDSMAASFAGLPSSTGQSGTIDCGAGSGPQTYSILPSSPVGTGTATTQCVYSQAGQSAVSAYPYTQYVASMLSNTQTSATLPIDYTPAAPIAACVWNNLPNVVVVGSQGQNSFIPSVQITNISSLPTEVDFSCGNGQTVRAIGNQIQQTGIQGQAITATATAISNCTYDFNSLPSGQQTGVLTVGVTMGGQACTGGTQQIIINSNVFGNMYSTMTATPTDPQNLGQIQQITVNLLNPIANLNEINPTANVNCGAGSTGGSQVEQVSLTNQGQGVYSGITTCTYAPVSVDTTRTVTATITSTQGPLPAPAPVSFIEYPAPVVANESNSCNMGLLYPLILGGFDTGSSSPSYAATQQAYTTAQENYVLQQNIASHQYFLIGPTQGGVNFVGTAPTSLSISVSPLFQQGQSAAVPVYNGFSQAEQVQINPTGGLPSQCFAVTPQLIRLNPGAYGQFTINYKYGPACQTSGTEAFTVAIVSTQASPAQLSVQVNVVAATSNYYQPQYSPTSGTSVTSSQQVVGVSNNYPQSSLAVGTANVQSGSSAQFNYTVGTPLQQSLTPSGSTLPAYSLTQGTAPAQFTGTLSSLNKFEVLGNVISSTTSATGCSGEDYCTKSAAQQAANFILPQLNSNLKSIQGQGSNGNSQSGSLNSFFNPNSQQCQQQFTSGLPGGMTQPTGQLPFCSGFTQSFVTGSQQLGSQMQQSPNFASLLLLSGLGGLNSEQSAACTQMLGCMMMMSQVMKNCQGSLGSTASLFPYLFCSSESSSSSGSSGIFGNSGALSLSFFMQQMCSQQASGSTGGSNGASQYYYLPLGASLPTTNVVAPGSGTVNVPIREIGDGTAIHVLGFNVQGNSYGSPSDTDLQGSQKGYPYLDCSSGQSSCTIAYDNGVPNLATLNKYGFASASAAGSVAVSSCQYSWSGSALASYGQNPATCTMMLATLTPSVLKDCTAGSACIVLQTPTTGSALNIAYIGGSTGGLVPVKFGVYGTDNKPHPLFEVASDIFTYLTNKNTPATALSNFASCKVDFASASSLVFACPNSVPTSSLSSQPTAPASSGPATGVLQTSSGGPITIGVATQLLGYHSVQMTLTPSGQDSTGVDWNDLVLTTNLVNVGLLCSPTPNSGFSSANCNLPELTGPLTMYVELTPNTQIAPTQFNFLLNLASQSNSWSAPVSLVSQSTAPAFSVTPNTPYTPGSPLSLTVTNADSTPYVGSITATALGPNGPVGISALLPFQVSSSGTTLAIDFSTTSQFKEIDFTDQLGGVVKITSNGNNQGSSGSGSGNPTCQQAIGLGTGNSLRQLINRLVTVSTQGTTMSLTWNAATNVPVIASLGYDGLSSQPGGQIISTVSLNSQTQTGQFTIPSTDDYDAYDLYVRPAACTSGALNSYYLVNWFAYYGGSSSLTSNLLCKVTQAQPETVSCQSDGS